MMYTAVYYAVTLFVTLQGCDTFTFSPAVAEQLIAVPDTLQAAADFEAAAARNGPFLSQGN